MNQSFLTTVLEKLRGKSLSTFLHRWRRAAWERQIEKATEEALRLAEEYKRRTNNRR
jgi:hypothetical protein